MTDLSLTKWSSNLSRITWFPIALVASIFLITMAFVLYEGREKAWTHFEQDLTKIIETEEKGFAEDIFLNQEEALSLRMDSIIRSWRRSAPDVRACLRIVPKSSSERTKIFTSCTYKTDRWEEGAHAHRTAPIRIGDKAIATMEYFVARQTGWDDIFPPRLVLALLIASLGGWLLHRHLVRNLQRTILNPLLERVARDERNAIIAQTTQMLAHDVMSPLRATQSVLESLRRVKGEAEFRAKRDQLVSQVESTIVTVRGMLGDIVWIGSDPVSRDQETPLRPIIMDTLSNTFLVHSKASVTIQYSFGHQHMVVADPMKIRRVFANLTENAIQAMGGSGKLSVRTREVIKGEKTVVEVCVANSGSYITPEEIKKIFERYYTTKKKGNGFGLTIAKTIVSDHGGEIWCLSTKEHGTEFYFTLPMGKNCENAHPVLPGHSDDFKKGALAYGSPEPAELPPQSVETILLFDDEQLVHDVWNTQASTLELPHLEHFASWEDFVTRDGHLKTRESVAFVDLNYKGSKFDGLDIARNLRTLGLKKIYAITGDETRASASGLFDAVFSKAMPTNIGSLI